MKELQKSAQNAFGASKEQSCFIRSNLRVQNISICYFGFIGALHYNILHIVIDGKSSKTCCLFKYVFNYSNDWK